MIEHKRPWACAQRFRSAKRNSIFLPLALLSLKKISLFIVLAVVLAEFTALWSAPVNTNEGIPSCSLAKRPMHAKGGQQLWRHGGCITPFHAGLHSGCRNMYTTQEAYYPHRYMLRCQSQACNPDDMHTENHLVYWYTVAGSLRQRMSCGTRRYLWE